ncbi:hypothetical protein K432DRAFT_383498 [Lepidopterella palustris CBS 459.81]|uniref:Uncharacterized protein n=1 Tax=Lepidopterella palustris CBS 459.81 TaxID=1314670 RepID=A0A8E2E7S5_9PEZI|nr:hypothetical protein K432DRAFT_383498 [Lepidopterella palustris CBS 459.81]
MERRMHAVYVTQPVTRPIPISHKPNGWICNCRITSHDHFIDGGRGAQLVHHPPPFCAPKGGGRDTVHPKHMRLISKPQNEKSKHPWGATEMDIFGRQLDQHPAGSSKGAVSSRISPRLPSSPPIGSRPHSNTSFRSPAGMQVIIVPSAGMATLIQ